MHVQGCRTGGAPGSYLPTLVMVIEGNSGVILTVRMLGLVPSPALDAVRDDLLAAVLR